MTRRVKIGAVSYLNTKPLVYRLGEFADCAEITFDLPSRLADSLADHKLDIALVPSIESLDHPEYRVVSDACIACRGPVLSVKLLSRVPMKRIRSLALDEGSRTSVALVRILLSEQLFVTPTLKRLPVGCDARDVETDAVLLIGDRAIHAPLDDFAEQWDLGERWWRWVGLPFVFAMWTARAGVDTSCVEAALGRARDAGQANLEAIAAEHAPAVGMSAGDCLTYLRDNLHFHLGDRERSGMALFARLASKLNDAPPGIFANNFSWQSNGCENS